MFRYWSRARATSQVVGVLVAVIVDSIVRRTGRGARVAGVVEGVGSGGLGCPGRGLRLRSVEGVPGRGACSAPSWSSTPSCGGAGRGRLRLVEGVRSYWSYWSTTAAPLVVEVVR